MESTCFNANPYIRNKNIMGPYSEDKQFQRATSIKRLLDDNPDMDPLYRAIWNKHLMNLALNETTYNYRVKNIYSNLRREIISWEQ